MPDTPPSPALPPGPPRRAPGANLPFIFAGAGLLLAVALGLMIWFATREGGFWGMVSESPVERAMLRNTAGAFFRKEFREAMRGRTQEDVNRATREVTERGLIFLDDALLVRRAEIFRQLLALADQRACARLARGAEQGFGIDSALAQLDSAALDFYFSLWMRSMMAALQGAEGRAVDPVELAAAEQTLYGRLTRAQAARVRDVRANPRRANDETACWATRLYYEKLLELPGSEKAILARGLVQR